MRNFPKLKANNEIITDGHVYDWWDLASPWGTYYLPRSDEPPGNKLLNATFTSEGVEDHGPHARWVRELMQKFSVRVHP